MPPGGSAAWAQTAEADLSGRKNARDEDYIHNSAVGCAKGALAGVVGFAGGELLGGAVDALLGGEAAEGLGALGGAGEDDTGALGGVCSFSADTLVATDQGSSRSATCGWATAWQPITAVLAHADPTIE